MKRLMPVLSLVIFAGAVSCSSGPSVYVEPYHVAYRQAPPEPVYSRLMWSQLPGPIRPKSTAEAPLYLPVVSIELPNATLGEAIEALATTMGYRWDYPSGLARRPVHIKMDGTADEILSEIGRQGGVQTMFDHEARMVRVMGDGVRPSLPGTP